MMFGGMLSMNNVSAATSLTLTSSGSQSIDVPLAADTAISSDSINVATSCRYGYNFTIQTSVDDNNLYLNGDSENYDTAMFWPANGYDPLNETFNEWGYYYDEDSVVPTSASVFLPVPMLSEEPAIIKAPLGTPSLSDINDSFNIYYGVSVAPDTQAGTYKMMLDESDNDGTIVYTVTVADECSRYKVHFSPTSIFEGNILSGTGTMDDQTIYDGISTALDYIGFTAPNGYYFAGWNTAQDGSGTFYADREQVTDIAAPGSTITLYAMWTDCPGNKICYFANVPDPNGVEGEMGRQTIRSSATSEVLYAPNFKRSGYGFVAWNTKADGSGTNYGPNQDIEFAVGQYRWMGLRLHAIWVASAGNMQNWSGCSSMNQGDVTALKDSRDNNVYAVAKLADGHCWMIENLRLADKDSSNNDIILSSSNTHNPSLPLTNIYDSGTISNHLSPTSSLTYDAMNAPEGWCNTNSAACIDQSRLRTDNTVLFTNNTSSSYSNSGNVYSYGNYYNWYSATAGHGVYSKVSGSTVGDICPAGWHLPTGYYNSAEFNLLDMALGGTGVSSNPNTTPTGETMSAIYRSYPNNFVYSGSIFYVNVNGGFSIYNRGSHGVYMSSRATYNKDNFGFDIDSLDVAPGTGGGNKYDGRVVRCIVDY